MNGQNFFENKKEKDDKPKISVALQYNPDEEAPKIIASGRGIGDMIPPELYGVVAEILVFVDECDRIRGKVKH